MYLSNIANVFIATGTILSIISLKIGASPVEETFVNGKPKRAALIEVIHPRFLKVGILLLILGSLLQLVSSIKGG